MIHGVGIDIVAISRIELAMKRAGFLPRILRPDEMRDEPSPEWVAGRWAAKEAIAKASPISLRWHDVRISPARDRVPLAEILVDAGLQVHLSISHDGGFAAAVALVQSSA